MTRPLVVVLGVSGSGKSTVGAALARRLGVPYADGDDFHPVANVTKMRAGVPLDDEDRWPWLDAIGRWLAEHRDGGVVSCSALRRAYRDRLRGAAPAVEFLLLDGDPDVIRKRQANRSDHFMPTVLMDSQLATLERLGGAEPGVPVDVDQDVAAVVEEYLRRRHG